MRASNPSSTREILKEFALLINRDLRLGEKPSKRRVLLKLEEHYNELIQLDYRLRRWLGNVVLGIDAISSHFLLAASQGKESNELVRLSHPEAERWPFHKAFKYQKIGWDISNVRLYQEFRAARSLQFLARRSDSTRVSNLLEGFSRIRGELSSFNFPQRHKIVQLILQANDVSKGHFEKAALGHLDIITHIPSLQPVLIERPYSPEMTDQEFERLIRTPVDSEKVKRSRRTTLAGLNPGR